MATRTVRRRVIVGLFRFVLLVVAVPVIWFIAALVLGSIPANVAWHEPDRGITLYIRTNGVHTWIVMPKVDPVMDWRPYAPGEDLRDSRYGRSDHVAIGYGNREFYLNTPTWGDLTQPAFYAAFGGDPCSTSSTLRPYPDEWKRPIRVTPASIAGWLLHPRPFPARARSLIWLIGRG